jgi:glycosyltransferase involved in cell wall biosynthesis
VSGVQPSAARATSSEARVTPSRGQANRVLLVYIEPAPYIVDFIRHLRARWKPEIETLFVSPALSQPWDHGETHAGDAFLPQTKWAAIKTLRRKLASKDFALVHLAGWGHPILLATLAMAKYYGVPATVESDTPPPAARGGWKALVKRLLYPPLFRLPAYFLPGGSRQRDYLRQYGVPETRLRIARMTVDVVRIKRFLAGFGDEERVSSSRRFGLPESGTRFLYLGRLEPHKGIDDLLAAFRLMRADRGDVFLIIAGSGSLAEKIVEAATKESSIFYLGRLSDNEVWEAYALADIVVLPSHFEPWGLVVNEALAAGRPVIVTDRAGCVPDLVAGKETGLIVPAGAPMSLSHAMKTLAADPTRRVALGRNAERLMDDWTLDGEAATTCSVWSAVLDR